MLGNKKKRYAWEQKKNMIRNKRKIEDIARRALRRPPTRAASARRRAGGRTSVGDETTAELLLNPGKGCFQIRARSALWDGFVIS